MVVVLATFAGCGGGDGDQDSSPTTRRQPSSSSTLVPGTEPRDGAPAAAPAPGGTGGPTDRGGSGGGATSTTSVSRSKAARPAGAPAAGATAPGRYRYASSGTFSVGPAGERPRSGESVLTVDPPAGADQHSLRQGVNRSTEQVLRFSPDGIYIVILKVSEEGVAREFRPSPPVLAFPYGAEVGRTWSWRMTSTDGNTTVEANFRIERKEPVQVASKSVPAVVVHATLATTGDVVSEGVQTLWVAEATRLVIREQSVTNGTFGGIPFRSTAREDLLHLSPS